MQGAVSLITCRDHDGSLLGDPHWLQDGKASYTHPSSSSTLILSFTAILLFLHFKILDSGVSRGRTSNAMAAWNFTICSSASSVSKRNDKNVHAEQVLLGMVPSPQFAANTIRGAESVYADQGIGGSPKRQYYAAFAEAMGDEEVMMVEEEAAGDGGGVVLKKRRLTMEQVRYLENSFESENKLEPERKAQIAHKLGLQPRQVAVWFQNRRARSKSKQLERDFNALKADYRAVVLENEKLQAEVDRLTAQLREGNTPPQEEGRMNLAAAMAAVEVIKASGSNVCSSYCGSAEVKVEGEAEAEASTASGGELEGRGNKLGDVEEQSSPCTILTDVNMNVNLSASVLTATGLPAAAAAVRAKAGVSENAASYEALVSEEIHFLTNWMQQAHYTHQVVDFCTDAVHYDHGLFISLDEPWSA